MQTLRFPEHVRTWLTERCRKRQREWLRGAGDWPLEIALGNPTETQALQHPDLVRGWIAAWQSWTGAGAVTWTERRWRTLGKQRLPTRLTLNGPEEVVIWADEVTRWTKARQRYERLATRWPAMAPHLPRHFDLLADYPDVDIERLESVVQWLEAHPRSGLYPRQLPIPGMHSKWVERQTGVLTDMLRALRGDGQADMEFHSLCGLRQPPHLMRLRILDPDLRRQAGGLSDISASLEELAVTTLRPSRVFIVENLQTGLAFAELPGSIVLIGKGYAIDALERLPWLAATDCHYWGDLDTHGLAILSRARNRLPHVKSLLMDEQTLLRHRALWVEEDRGQHPAAELPNLSPAEQGLYRALKEQRWALNVRLEQERIDWSQAWRAMQTAAFDSQVS